jgi:hypothetical protein
LPQAQQKVRSPKRKTLGVSVTKQPNNQQPTTNKLTENDDLKVIDCFAV